MGKYNFDEIIDRRGTSCLKYDSQMAIKGRDDLLPLWVADMDFRLPDEILDDIAGRVRHGIFGYTEPDERYYEALNKWFRTRHGFEIRESWNTIAPGVVYALACTVRAFTKPGEAVMIQQPVYYPFSGIITQSGRKVVNSQLVLKDGRYEMDLEDFERKIEENDVKLFLLCSPHNPVGRVWTREELIKVGDICRAHGVYIFSDEIHWDFIYQGHQHTSFITLGEPYTERLILGTSPSKTFNIAGLQIANIIIPNEDTRKRYRHENDATGYGLGNALGMAAAQSVYEKGDEWLDELMAYLEGNVAFVREFVSAHLPGVRLTEPEGTYLLWLDFSGYTNDHRDLERLIVDEAKLWLDPGIIFSKETALFERINAACPRKILEQAMGQLYDACCVRAGH